MLILFQNRLHWILPYLCNALLRSHCPVNETLHSFRGIYFPKSPMKEDNTVVPLHRFGAVAQRCSVTLARQGIEHSFPKSQVVSLTTVTAYSLHQNKWFSQRPCTAFPSVSTDFQAPWQIY